MIRNTCAFDSIVQSLLIGYWIAYHEYINNTSNYISDFIKIISTFGTLQKVYKERALILNKIFRPTGGTMDCVCNVSHKLSSNRVPIVVGLTKMTLGTTIAHCRRVMGNWEIYDDLNKNKTSLTTSTKILL